MRRGLGRLLRTVLVLQLEFNLSRHQATGMYTKVGSLVIALQLLYISKQLLTGSWCSLISWLAIYTNY